MRMWEASLISANSTFVFLGNFSCRSRRGPNFSIGTSCASSTKITQCGLPMETQVMENVSPSASIGCSMTRDAPKPRTGMRSPSRIGSPISTRTPVSLLPASCRRGTRTPAPVSTVNSASLLSPSAWTTPAKQRMPLPHISASVPSALKMRMRKSACSDGSTRISPSAPMP